ncbi:MAG: phage holin family protein [Actinobacteria bacterium]|nr:phage holin family protein [Actinomycetota bacterium]
MSTATPREPRGAYEAATDRPPAAHEPREPDASLPELISRLTDQSSRLFRQEIELAKTEIKQEIRQAGKAGGMFGGAAFVGFLAAVLLSFALAWALGDLEPLNPALGFLIVGVIYAIVAGVLAMSGRSAAEDIDPSLPETTESLKEDAQWAKNQPR